MDDFLSGLLKIIGFLIVFGSILFLVIVTTKLIGTKAKQSMRGRYINVVESINLGLDKCLYLIRVVDDYILISSSGKKIEFLTAVKMTELVDEGQNLNNGMLNFKMLFDKYLNKGDQKQQEAEIGLKTNQNRFNYNLLKIKNIINKVKTKDKSFGDDINGKD